MFEKKVEYLELSGQKVPIKCDLLVLEKIQEAYGDLSVFENKLMGFVPSLDEEGNPEKNEDGLQVGKYGMPDIKVLNQALIWFAEEGAVCEECEADRPEGTDLLRMADIRPDDLGNMLHKEFMRCFERKNESPTQKVDTRNKTNRGK